jgi:anaerobic ribonucleoside-triphosphate reductase activating protein
MKVLLSRAFFPITVLGPGNRIGIWFQGCSIKCPGCISQDTWELQDAHEIAVRDLLDWCENIVGRGINGITISGGEPFEQPDALNELLDGLILLRRRAGYEFDVLCYSGMPIRKLTRVHSETLKKIDAIVPEPFVETLPNTDVWRGSSNQPILVLSDRGERVYAPYMHTAAGKCQDNIQLAVSDGVVTFFGIPNRGDMTALTERVRSRGVDLREVSWRP